MMVSSPRFLASALATCLLFQAASVRAEPDGPRCRILPADARVHQNGKVLDSGVFTLWDRGLIGDSFVVPRPGTVRVNIHAAAQVQDDVPARLAVDLLPVDGLSIRLGVVEVRSARFSYGDDCDYADYAVSAPLSAGYYGLQITHLNRTVEEGKWRHCFVAHVEIEGARRAECSPAAYAFFGREDDSRSDAAGVETETIATDGLRVEVVPETATWSVLHRESGNGASGIHPVFRVAGLPVDLSNYDVEHVREPVRDKALGDAVQVTMHYREADELDVTYCLLVSQKASEVVARIDITNRTGRELVIDSIAPMVTAGMSLGKDASRWTVIGDGKQYRHPYRIVDVAGLEEFDC